MKTNPSNQNKMSNVDFFGFAPPPEDDSIKYFKQVIPVTLHHYYITDEIGDVEPFLDLINTLKTAEQHDTIFIYLNTPGGSLTTTIQIISAMRQSNATVVTCLEGEVCSAGTMIFLTGHKHIVNANCTFMIHNYSHWVGGKGNEVNVRVKYTEEYFRKLAENIYGKFLTTEEIKGVLDGKDLWMDSDEVLSRLGVEAEGDEPTLVEEIEPIIEVKLKVEEPKAAKRPPKKKVDKKVDKAPEGKKSVLYRP